MVEKESRLEEQSENEENETGSASDPNIVGSADTAGIQNRVAGPMTPCSEYDNNTSNHGAAKYGGY